MEVGGKSERLRVGMSATFIVAVAVATALAVLSFARAWTYSFDRPWFPLLMILTLGLASLWIRTLVLSWHIVEFVDHPRPVLRLAGPFGRLRELPLDDVEDVAIIDWAWKRSDHVSLPDGGSVTNTYEGADRILLIRRKDDAIAMGSAARRDVERYARLAERIAAATIERPPTKSGRGRHRHGPFVRVPIDTFWVNHAVLASRRPASLWAVPGSMAGVALAFVAVWTARHYAGGGAAPRSGDCQHRSVRSLHRVLLGLTRGRSLCSKPSCRQRSQTRPSPGFEP